MYNEEIKNRFLNEHREDTAITYKRIFDISENTEEQLEKDLYNFNRTEMGSVMWDLNPLTENAAISYGNIIRLYIRWAIKNGFRRNNDNPLDYVQPDYFGQFVDKEKQLYVTENELRTIENWIVNPQDRVIYRLLFEGVSGKHLSELRNLKRSDVNFSENKLVLTDVDGSQRELTVSDRCINAVKEAIDIDVYYMNNGEMPASSRHDGVRDLDDGEYVIRGTLTNLKSKGDSVGKNIIYKRIKNVVNFLGLDIEAINYFSSKTISRSGMIYYGKHLLETEGQLSNEQYQKIADRFGIQTIYVVKKIVNDKVIGQLYQK